jgi:hypothetical protein
MATVPLHPTAAGVLLSAGVSWPVAVNDTVAYDTSAERTFSGCDTGSDGVDHYNYIII